MRAHLVRRCVVAVLAIVPLVMQAGIAAQGGAQKSALVTVISESGAPIKDLAARDFVVREDNASREVTGAELAPEPLFISLLVDTTQPPPGSPASITQDLRRALTTFVKEIQAVSPDAQIAVMEFAGASVTTLDFTSKSDALEKTVQRLFPNQQAGAVLLEALSDASRKLSDKETPRRAIVSIDFNSPEGSAEQSMKKVAEEVRKGGATVWAVSIRGGTASANPREAVLNAVTQASGGLRLTAVDSSGLEPMLKKVANSLTSQYTVTFMRPGNATPKAVRFETTRGTKVQMTPWMR
jgi:von Willebrand factor type A domain